MSVTCVISTKLQLSHCSFYHNPPSTLLRNQGRGHGPLPRLRGLAGFGFEPASCASGYCSSTVGHRPAGCVTLHTTSPFHTRTSSPGAFEFQLLSPTFIRIEPNQDSNPRPEGCRPGACRPELTDLTGGLVFCDISLCRASTLKT